MYGKRHHKALKREMVGMENMQICGMDDGSKWCNTTTCGEFYKFISQKT